MQLILVRNWCGPWPDIEIPNQRKFCPRLFQAIARDEELPSLKRKVSILSTHIPDMARSPKADAVSEGRAPFVTQISSDSPDLRFLQVSFCNERWCQKACLGDFTLDASPNKKALPVSLNSIGATPPGITIRTFCPLITPKNLAAAATATALVPEDMVGPSPRSNTLARTSADRVTLAPSAFG
jgi:hypothetical protein